MKLRKLLAGITAAALAVSAMAFSSLTASAEGETSFAKTTNVSAKSVTVGYTLSTDKTNDYEYMYSNCEIVVKTWNDTANAGDWLQNGVGGSNQAQYYAGSTQKWVQSYEGTALDSTFTVNLTEYDVLNELEILYKEDAGGVFKLNLTSVKAYSDKDGKGDVVWEYPATTGTQEPEVTLPILFELTGESNKTSRASWTPIVYTAKSEDLATVIKNADDYALEVKFVLSKLLAEFHNNGNTTQNNIKINVMDDGDNRAFPKRVSNKEITIDGDNSELLTLTIPMSELKFTADDIADGTIKVSIQCADGPGNSEDEYVMVDQINIVKNTAVKPADPDTPSTGGEQTGGSSGDNTTPSAPTVSSNKHQGVGMPPVVINQKSAPAASAGAGETAAASGSASVTLSDSTVVSKDAIDSVAGKDAEFKLSNGASWEIAAADAAKAEGMDLGITLNTTAATADQLKEVAKDNDTFQFSLAYSGDFGFSAVINIPVDAKYNGKYANLYWLNGGKLEFIGSSKVEGGIADFTMKHASDYVIVFDDEAYGEDVSSGAGIYEESETSSAPVAVVVTFAALAVSAVILKKRVF